MSPKTRSKTRSMDSSAVHKMGRATLLVDLVPVAVPLMTRKDSSQRIPFILRQLTLRLAALTEHHAESSSNWQRTETERRTERFGSKFFNDLPEITAIGSRALIALMPCQHEHQFCLSRINTQDFKTSVCIDHSHALGASDATRHQWEQHVRRPQNQQVRGHHSRCGDFVMEISRTRRMRFLRAERVVGFGCCQMPG